MTMWTEQRVEELRGFLMQGLSSGVIAKEMGCTRNAVIGKVDRMRLVESSFPRLRQPVKKQKPAKKFGVARDGFYRIKKMVQMRMDFKPRRDGEPMSLQVKLLDLEKGQCRFPHGEGSHIRFCGHPVAVSSRSSYCAYHAKLCELKVDG